MNTLEKNIDAFDDEDDEIIETIVINVDPGQTFMRLDKYISHHLKNITRNSIQNAI